MAVINRTGVYIFKKMYCVHSIILVLVLFGAEFSFAHQRSCDLVKTDIQQISKLHLIGYLDQPETGKNLLMLQSFIIVVIDVSIIYADLFRIYVITDPIFVKS